MDRGARANPTRPGGHPTVAMATPVAVLEHGTSRDTQGVCQRRGVGHQSARAGRNPEPGQEAATVPQLGAGTTGVLPRRQHTRAASS
eukprot:5008388-Lingulodinium_polyedra.AAC.1